MQSTRMHIKDHIGKTTFLLVHNECCPPLAIIDHPINKTDQVLEAQNISHYPFSEPNPEIITKNLTFLGNLKSTAIT